MSKGSPIRDRTLMLLAIPEECPILEETMRIEGRSMNGSDMLDELSDYISIRLDATGRIRYDSNWSSNVVHHNYALWIILSGQMRIHLDGQEYHADVGDIVFLYPDCLVAASTAEAGCQCIYIHFDFAIGNQNRALCGLGLGGIAPKDIVSEEVNSFERAYIALERGHLFLSQYMKGCILMLIARLLAKDDEGSARKRFPEDFSLNCATMSLTRLEPALHFVKQHLFSAFTVKDLAESVNMSEKYFSTFFKNLLGTTPSQHVFKLKMTHAMEYIYESDLSMKEIACKLGYPDQYAFSKAFKRYFHIAPSRFR
jgi:AraC family transcriptional regulator